VFPVRYELGLYIFFRRSSASKGLFRCIMRLYLFRVLLSRCLRPQQREGPTIIRPLTVKSLISLLPIIMNIAAPKQFGSGVGKRTLCMRVGFVSERVFKIKFVL
jgi:hypothetical protein